jgi:hypothetical protein
LIITENQINEMFDIAQDSLQAAALR